MRIKTELLDSVVKNERVFSVRGGNRGWRLRRCVTLKEREVPS